jgi:small-conductance mechanosensitive channel
MQNLLLVVTSLAEHAQRWLAATDLTLLATQLGGALLLGIIVYWGLGALARVLSRRLAGASARGGQTNLFLSSLSRIIGRTSQLFLLIAAITAGSLSLPISGAQFALIHRIFDVALILQMAIWVSIAFTSWLDQVGRGSGTDYRALSNAHAIIGTIVRVGLWSIAVMLVFDNLGFNVTALVTGLGIGGIAIGLAVQKILADLFASLAILLDRPFEYGDFIVTGSQMGTVEQIGLKTTRLRAPSGEQLVIANSDLLDSRIQNFKRMNERRVIFQFGVVAGTSSDGLKRVPQLVEEAVKQQKLARFERCHLVSFADTALRFETSYLVSTPDMKAYMDCHQAILLDIYRRCEELKILIAMAIPGGLPPLQSAPPQPAVAR